MAEFYETPERENIEKIAKLEDVLEMKTFKTNIEPEPEFIPPSVASEDSIKAEVKHKQTFGENIRLKILCVGDYSGSYSKGVYIEDYLHSGPPIAEDRGPIIGCDFHSKSLKTLCRTSNGQITNQIKLQIWNISEQDRSPTPGCYRKANGAIVFWGARSSSLESALKWRRRIQVYDDFPVVLMVDNVSRSPKVRPPVSWIGHGKIISSEEKMNEFCHQHNIFAWFEMFSRETGEESVFGQAIARLIDEIMKRSTVA